MICKKCGKDKSLEAFAIRNKGTGRRQSWCKECVREYDKLRYTDPKVRQGFIDRSKRRQIEWRKKLFEYLKDKKCMDCRESNSIVLEFDHIKGEKTCNISDLIRKTPSWEKILIEIEKCEIVCANCHRIRTAKTFNWYKYIEESVVINE